MFFFIITNKVFDSYRSFAYNNIISNSILNLIMVTMDNIHFAYYYLIICYYKTLNLLIFYASCFLINNMGSKKMKKKYGE